MIGPVFYFLTIWVKEIEFRISKNKAKYCWLFYFIKLYPTCNWK